MNIEWYCISAVCQWDEAAVYSITRMKPNLFSQKNQPLYKIAIGLYKKFKTVDLGVFVSQAGGVGMDQGEAAMLYHYAQEFDDKWQHNFEELQRLGSYRILSERIEDINSLKTAQEPITKISSAMMNAATEMITGQQKTYLSGEEVDNTGDEYGKPILTGYDLYDNQIYKNGGNRTGQMKGVILREKHGKTRSECWEVAQNIRMGHKVLYLALEGTKKEITGLVKEVLRSDWEQYRNNFFVADGLVMLEDIEATILEAVLVEGVEKVVIDYAQLIQVEGASNENVRINIATEKMRELMIRYNFHCVCINQARKEDPNAQLPKDAAGNNIAPKGYRFVPNVYDAYGSNALVKAASIILIGFRPSRYPELVTVNPLGKKVINPLKGQASFHSVFMKVAIARQKNNYLNDWFSFTDTDEGFKPNGWVGRPEPTPLQRDNMPKQKQNIPMPTGEHYAPF